MVCILHSIALGHPFCLPLSLAINSNLMLMLLCPVGSNPTRGMDVPVSVVSCLVKVFATGC